MIYCNCETESCEKKKDILVHIVNGSHGIPQKFQTAASMEEKEGQGRDHNFQTVKIKESGRIVRKVLKMLLILKN